MAYARGVTDNLKYSLNRVYTINRLVTAKEDRYTYYFDIFKYHSNWKNHGLTGTAPLYHL